jgi:hypothetical protein
MSFATGFMITAIVAGIIALISFKDVIAGR